MVNNMSVKDRVSQFEAIAEEDRKEAEKAAAIPGKPPRFLYPGSKQKQDQTSVSVSKSSQIKPQASSTGVNLDLEGVWNIRKNVTVGKSKSNQPIYPLTTGSYSRHGAVSTRGQASNDNDDFSFSTGIRGQNNATRLPDISRPNGSTARSWKTPNHGVYSYSEAAKRRRASPPEETVESPPSAKRRMTGGLQSVGDEFEARFAPKATEIRGNPEREKKLRYAQKMAAGHLRSAGLGEFTPKASMYRKDRDSNESNNGYTARWKHPRDDTDP